MPGSPITSAKKKQIAEAVDELVEDLSEKMTIPKEAVGNEVFYRAQRHPDWGRNPTETQKNASFKHWGGKCSKCKTKVARNKAKFHHLKRGVKGQHLPRNMVPQHVKCHDAEHEVRKGSLSKGSPERQAK